MAEPHIVSTLRRKRDEMETLIRAYEKKIEAARRDLSHIHATLRMFELGGEYEVFPVHMDLTRLFARGEVHGICREALAQSPAGLDTRELALAVIPRQGP